LPINLEVAKLTVKLINKSTNPLPSYQTKGSAGLDLHAYTTEEIEIYPLDRKLISTGLYFEIPENYEAQIRPRSGLALKNGITVLNAPGTIDSDYRGEIKVLLVNLSNDTFRINNGDRIAQVIFAPTIQAELIEVDELNKTIRGIGGYGHTGQK
jgi:dUTP pyrophosphatase